MCGGRPARQAAFEHFRGNFLQGHLVQAIEQRRGVGIRGRKNSAEKRSQFFIAGLADANGADQSKHHALISLAIRAVRLPGGISV